MNNSIKVKAVFLDMDGTVLNTEPFYISALENAMKQLGIKNDVNYPVRCIGISSVEMRKLFISEVGTEQEYEKVIKLGRTLAEEYKIKQGIKTHGGFYELINKLAENNVKSYIVTSTPRNVALNNLKQAGIINYFAGFICKGDYENSKPHPEPYLTALKLSGELAENCIAIEDSPAGLTSATSAGLKCVLIRDIAEIPPETAELTYADLKSLKDVINLIM